MADGAVADWGAYWDGLAADGAITPAADAAPALLRPISDAQYRDLLAVFRRSAGDVDKGMWRRLADAGLIEGRHCHKPTPLACEIVLDRLAAEGLVTRRRLAIGTPLFFATVNPLAAHIGVEETAVALRFPVHDFPQGYAMGYLAADGTCLVAEEGPRHGAALTLIEETRYQSVFRLSEYDLRVAGRDVAGPPVLRRAFLARDAAISFLRPIAEGIAASARALMGG